MGTNVNREDPMQEEQVGSPAPTTEAAAGSLQTAAELKSGQGPASRFFHGRFANTLALLGGALLALALVAVVTVSMDGASGAATLSGVTSRADSAPTTQEATSAPTLEPGAAGSGRGPVQMLVTQRPSSSIEQAPVITRTVGDRSVLTYSGHMTGALTIAWSPDGRTIAAGSSDKMVRLLDTQTGQVTTLPGHTDIVYHVAWSPDGKTLASGSTDTTVRLWSADGTPLQIITGHKSPISGLAWLKGTGQLVSASANLNLLSVQPDPGATPVAAQPTGDLLTGAVWSPDGKILATGSVDRTISLWQPDGTLINTLFGHTDQVYCLAWSPDGKILASGGNDKTVRLWSSEGTPLATLRGHTDFVNSVAWSPDGKTLASAGAGDKTARLWSSEGASLDVLTGHTGQVLSVAWSPDGKTLATAVSDGSIWLWR